MRVRFAVTLSLLVLPAHFFTPGFPWADAAGPVKNPKSVIRDNLFQPIPGQPGFEMVTFNKDNFGTVDSRLYCAVTMPDGSFWVGGYNKLLRFDGRAWKMMNALSEPYEKLSYTVSARDMLVDREGTLWVFFGSQRDDAGIYRYRKGKWLEPIKKVADVRVANSAVQEMRSMTIDPQGDIWLAFGIDGLAKFHDSKWEWMHGGFSARNPKSRVCVTSVGAQADGTRWIGTLSDGLVRQRGNTRNSYGPTDETFQAKGVCAIDVAADGRVAIATEFQSGVVVIEGDKWNRYALASRPEVVRLAADGSVWVGSIMNATVTRIEGEKYQHFPFEAIRNSPAGLYVDPSGTIWVCGVNGVCGIRKKR